MNDHERQHRRFRVPRADAEVLVGVDASSCAAKALRWAGREAVLRRARLRIVHVWAAAQPPPASGPITASANTSEHMHRRDAEELVEGAARDFAGAGLEVKAEAIPGRPESVLVRMSADADLLVVGSSGHHELFGLLLGSVAQHCVRHARCPVAVIPPTSLAGMADAVPRSAPSPT